MLASQFGTPAFFYHGRRIIANIERLRAALEGAGTIVWNGPVGVFEFDQFGEGTRILAQAVARSPAFSIAGQSRPVRPPADIGL